MGPFIVVEVEVLTKAASDLSSVLAGVQVYLSVLHRPPQTFDQQVIVVASFAVHADSHPIVLQERLESFTGKLGTLVGKDVNLDLYQALCSSS